jgi:hypothetical protein
MLHKLHPKILYLVDPMPDYLSDQIYYGLCKTIGSQNVVDFPSKPLYHDPLHKVSYFPQLPGQSYSDDDVIEMLASKVFDFVCLASPRPVNLETLRLLTKKIALPPLVIMDGEDDSRMRYDIAEAFEPRLYFKREYIWKNNRRVRYLKDSYNYIRSFHYNNNLFRITRPLPFSVIMETIPEATGVQKDIDVSFRGFAWSKMSRKRIQAYRILRRAKSVNLSGAIYTPRDMSGKLSPNDYFSEIQKSKIAISMRGGGFDTQRFWEIVACKTLLISEVPDIDIPEAFEHKKHAVFCKSNLSDLEELVRYYLENDREREEIVKQGYQHLLNYHTSEKRANYFLDICLKEI